MPTVNPGLQKLVREALDLGLRCFEEGDHAPFVIIHADGDSQLINLQRSDGMVDEVLLKGGRALIQESAAAGHYYVLVYDGYLTTAGKRWDAVLGEAGSADGGPGRVFAQRYTPTQSGRMFRVGKLRVVANIANLWSDDAPQILERKSKKRRRREAGARSSKGGVGGRKTNGS